MPSPTGSPSPPPSPTPTPVGEAPATRIRFEGLGTDDPASEQALKRTFRFATDGPGTVEAAVDGTTGGAVEVCIFQGTPEAPRTPPFCVDMRQSAVRSTVRRSTEWTVTVIGAHEGTTPVTNLTLTFRARRSSLDVSGFRFQGTSAPAYNGLDAVLDARTGGALAFDAHWSEQGGSGVHDWSLSLSDLTGEDPPEEASGTGVSASRVSELLPARSYRIRLQNTATLVATQVFLSASFRWP